MSDPASLSDYMADCRQRVESALDRVLPNAEVAPATLHKAMREAILSGGKRVRPMLVYAAGRALDTPPQRLDTAACAVELIHGYSLVHDDLPAMDDDDLRRGRPTCHKVYGEAMAILAGDALQTLAFHVLCKDAGFDPGERLAMVEALTLASGSRGMAGGQAMDLEAEGEELDFPTLEKVHIHKTGALIRTSVLLGASGSGIDATRRHNLDRYAQCIGLAFQIRDDILDVEGDTRTLGKMRGADRARQKSTYPELLGLDVAKQEAADLCQEAIEKLARFDHGADPLRWLADYIIDRRS